MEVKLNSEVNQVNEKYSVDWIEADYTGDCDIILDNKKYSLEMKLDEHFNLPIRKGIIPESVDKLVFGKYFNSEIEVNSLPYNLKFLEFGDCFNGELQPQTLKPPLRNLVFGQSFNKSIEPNVLPNTLQYLKLGHKFNKEIKSESLPNSLIVLEFSSDSFFNKPIKKNTLPQSIKKIIFPNGYNQLIKPKRLPNNLVHLSLGSQYVYRIQKKVLPSGLKYLFKGGVLNIDSDAIPEELQVIKLDCRDLPLFASKPIKKIICDKLNWEKASDVFIPASPCEIHFSFGKMNPEILPNRTSCLIINNSGEIIN
jgi:hypothetical protein